MPEFYHWPTLSTTHEDVYMLTGIQSGIAVHPAPPESAQQSHVRIEHMDNERSELSLGCSRPTRPLVAIALGTKQQQRNSLLTSLNRKTVIMAGKCTRTMRTTCSSQLN